MIRRKINCRAFRPVRELVEIVLRFSLLPIWSSSPCAYLSQLAPVSCSLQWPFSSSRPDLEILVFFVLIHFFLRHLAR